MSVRGDIRSEIEAEWRRKNIKKSSTDEQSSSKVTLSYPGEKSFMPRKIMEDCWANFSVIYGLTFGQEESSITI